MPANGNTGHDSRRAPRFSSGLLAVALGGGAEAATAAEFGASWTGDFATVASGGLQRGERHLGLVELTADHAFTLFQREVELHASVQHVYGGGFSESFVGDLQTVSNIDADDGTRLLQAWVDVPLTEAISLKLGRYDLNSEFDAIEAGGLFLSSSQGIGPDISQTGAAGPSIFPRTALGVRAQYEAGGRGTVRGVALDVESDPDANYGDTPFIGGTLFALEYEFAPRATRWKAGGWSFSRSRPSLTEPGERDHEFGAYASVEHRIDANWTAYARVGAANAEVSRIGAYLGAGLVHGAGLLPGRDDPIGLAVAHARNGSPYRDALRAEGLDTTAAETAVELTWRVPVGERVVLQPDVQYVIDPDTDPGIEDALVLMLRVELVF